MPEDQNLPITRNRIDTHGDGDSSCREVSITITTAPVSWSPEGGMPAETDTLRSCVLPCAPSYGAAMATPVEDTEDDRPTDAQIAEYRAKYGPPVPPTDLGAPEDPDSFRALAAELRGESG